MLPEQKNIIPAAINPALRRQVIPNNSSNPADAQIPAQNINNTKLDLSYEINGQGSQFVVIKLRSGQSIIGEVTALIYYETGISMKMRMSAVTEPNNSSFLSKLLGIGKAAIKGQKLFMMTFTNTSPKELKIAFAMPYMGEVVAVNMAQLGGEVFCQNDSFLCATSDLKISSMAPREIGANFLTTVTSIQKIQGNGTLFLFCGGNLMERNLISGESLNVSTGTVLAMQPGIIFKNKTIRNVGMTGQGHMLTEISGSGRVWLQSLPHSIAKNNIIEHIGVFFGLKPKKVNPLWGKK